MVGTATITGKVGPGLTVTSLALADVVRIETDIEHNTITFFYRKNGGRIMSLCIDLYDTSSITSTITENVSLATTITNA